MQTRRQFIKDTTTIAGGAGLGLALSPRILAESKGAAERVVFGLIGCGTMSRENMRHFLELNQPVAAVCDVDKAHLERAAGEVVKAGQAAPKRIRVSLGQLGARGGPVHRLRARLWRGQEVVIFAFRQASRVAG